MYVMGKIKDLVGNKYNHLTVIAFAKQNSHGQSMWLCKCDCKSQTEKIILGTKLTSGYTKSCGCLRLQSPNYKHGKRKSGTFNSWASMKQRCLNKNAKIYKEYGGRGISICERWMNFINFYEDMGDRPEGMSLDRINNNLGYEKSNCRWATRMVQSANRSKFKTTASGVKGVYHSTSRGRNHYWKVVIRQHNKIVFHKSFPYTPEGLQMAGECHKAMHKIFYPMVG